MKKNNNQELERLKLAKTEQVSTAGLQDDDLAQLEQELRQMTKEELLFRLHNVEEDHKVIKLIKKIIKEKK